MTTTEFVASVFSVSRREARTLIRGGGITLWTVPHGYRFSRMVSKNVMECVLGTEAPPFPSIALTPCSLTARREE